MHDHSNRTPYRRAVVLSASIVLATCVAVIVVGWGLDVSAVRSVFPGAVGMKALTAFGLGACAVALVLLGPQAPRRSRTTGRALAAGAGLLGLAVLAEYVFAIDLGIDEALFVDHAGRTAGIAYPGRFAPTTGVCLVMTSAAILLLDRGRSWRWRPAELLAIPTALIAFMSLIGYAYSIPAFYGPASAAKMAVNTALCFVALAVVVLVSRPRGRFLELATTRDPGGVMVRRMVPLCLVVPLVLGWLHVRTVQWGLYNAQVGAWWLAAATIVGLVLMMWWCGGTLSRADRERRVLEDQLYELANRDQLTGLFNRHRFEEELDGFLARARRYGDDGSLMLFDLDRLKPINDELGHAAGDEILRLVAQRVSGLLRDSDVIGRLGGDEFAVLLLHASPQDAVARAEDIRAAIAGLRLTTPAGEGWTSASIGVVSVEPTAGLSSSELLGRADVAMYRAKRAGGDRVALAGRAVALSA